MPFIGDIKRAFCSVCQKETEWEYVIVEHADGFLGIDNLIHPEEYQIKFWRCSEHMTEEGRIKEEVLKKYRHITHSY